MTHRIWRISMKNALKIWALALIALTTTSTFAKLPTLSEEAKIKASETAAKNAWNDKVAGYQLCQSMDRVAASYHVQMRASGKGSVPTATPPCTHPGEFSYQSKEVKPLEAAGAHSPPQTAATPPNTTQPAATTGLKP